MCIWEVDESKRHCEYCSYFDGCETRAPKSATAFELDSKAAVDAMSEIVPFDLANPCRHSNIVWARYMVEYYLRSLGYSLNRIGSLFKRDHTTVMHSVREVEKMLQTPAFYEKEAKVWDEFNQKLSLKNQ